MATPRRQKAIDGDEVVREYYEDVPSPESEAYRDQTDTVTHVDPDADEDPRSAALKGGDPDVASSGLDVGTESPGGSNPTPDQDRVDEIGASMGVIYDDAEPLKFGEKKAAHDASRWELNSASSEGYVDRQRAEQMPRTSAPGRSTRGEEAARPRRRTGRAARTQKPAASARPVKRRGQRRKHR